MGNIPQSTLPPNRGRYDASMALFLSLSQYGEFLSFPTFNESENYWKLVGTYTPQPL